MQRLEVKKSWGHGLDSVPSDGLGWISSLERSVVSAARQLRLRAEILASFSIFLFVLFLVSQRTNFILFHENRFSRERALREEGH